MIVVMVSLKQLFIAILSLNPLITLGTMLMRNYLDFQALLQTTSDILTTI